MNPLWGHAIGVMIVVLMLVFTGIWIWAWLPRHAGEFAALARIPMLDEPPGESGVSGDEDVAP